MARPAAVGEFDVRCGTDRHEHGVGGGPSTRRAASVRSPRPTQSRIAATFVSRQKVYPGGRRSAEHLSRFGSESRKQRQPGGLDDGDVDAFATRGRGDLEPDPSRADDGQGRAFCAVREFSATESPKVRR